MHLHKFVSQRKEAWNRLQSVLADIEKKGLPHIPDHHLEEFIKLYRQASSDLNYLRTYFRDSDHTIALNNLVSRCHAYAQTENEPLLKKAGVFFGHGFPRLLRQEYKLFFLATGFFILMSFLAFLSVQTDTHWADTLLPAEQRKQLDLSISSFREGEEVIPVTMQPFFTSIIVTNNIQVSFLAFAGGIPGGLGTIYVLAVNGMMLGSYAGFFALQNHSLPFWGLILPHGIMELTAIFICATGGLMLGRAVVIPGDYRRSDAVKLAGKKAVLLLSGTVPLFVIAAIIEGFITPAPLHSYARLAFAAFTLAGLIYYFFRP